MITKIRTFNHQLAEPRFDRPADIVRWMGAMQAQEYTMAKWAIGVRMKTGTLTQVEQALEQGEIIRTHIMRPTWHFVPAEDLRWMLQLSGHRVRRGYDSYAKSLAVHEDTHTKCGKLFEKLLRDHNHLTRQEIGQALIQAGLPGDDHHVGYFLIRGEAAGLLCSGADKNGKVTYALVDERIAPTKVLHKDEALAKLARRYFRSHSPAGLQDFLWWSGLTLTECRHAIHLIEAELIKDRFDAQDLYLHHSCSEDKPCDDVVHFLPSYDEYLISYKDRTAALNPKHNPKAFTNFGIFYPVIMYKGKIVGNWKKMTKKGITTIETTFFESKMKVGKRLLQQAERRFLDYILL